MKYDFEGTEIQAQGQTTLTYVEKGCSVVNLEVYGRDLQIVDLTPEQALSLARDLQQASMFAQANAELVRVGV